MSTSKSEVGTIGPVEILGATSFSLDAATQNSINQAVSRATRSSRQWDRKTLYAAYKAARPLVEQSLRAQGKSFTSAQVRATVRPYVKAYVDQFAVQTPPGSLIGASPLQAVAGEVLVGFAMPWQMFMPPQVVLAQKLAQQGQPQAKSWLSKFFGGKKSAPAATPAPTPVAATPAPGAAVLAPVAPVVSAPVVAHAATEDTAGGSGDSLGAWLHRLNPGYWLHTAEERKLIDAEKQAWIDNAYNAKQEAKKQATVDIAMKALTAKQTAASAYAKTSELDAQLKAIESQVLGACASDVGRQEILGDDAKVNPYEGDEIPERDALPVVRKLAKARKLNIANAGDIKPLADKLSRGLPLSPDESSKLLLLLARNEQLHEFRKGIVSGDLYSTNPSAKKIKKQVMIGAAKAMTPAEQSMLAQMVALAKTGNPNAKAALASLKAQGYAATMGASPAAMTSAEKQMLAQMIKSAKAGHHNSQQALMALKAQGYTFSLGGKSFIGFGISDAFNLAMKPITLPAQYLWKGVKAAGRAVGITKGGSPSAEQVRLNRLQAAQKRIQAAQARASAADAQSEAEFRVQQQLAAAADAEADAADAEAQSKTAAMQAAEQQFMPGVAEQEDDQSGAVKPVITPLPDTLTQSEKDAELERIMTKATKKTHASLMASRRSYVAKKNPKAAAILKASEEKTPVGMKLQAAMKMVVAYQAGDKQTKRAVDAMAARASKGDKQAKADMNAINAAIFAYNADQKAGKHVARVAAYKAATAKVVAVRTRASVAASDALIRNSRRRAFNQVVKLEIKAAAGDKKAQAIVKKHVELAKKGDKKSQNLVNGLKTAQTLRKTAPTRAEQRRIAQARRMARKYNAGNKKVVTDVRVMVAAAKHGNPNAKRGVDRLKKGAAVEKYLATGTFVATTAIVVDQKQKVDKKAAAKKRLASIETKVNKGTASKEEAQAAAKLASDAGEHEKAKELATVAKSLPSAKDELQRVATIATAADAGHPASQASVDKALKAAAAGEPDGIEAAGKIAGVQALHQVAQGKPLTPEMKTAVADLSAAQAGDEKVVEKIASMQARAKEKDPEAIKYVAVAAGATMVSRALADNPVAHEEWLVKAGVKPVDASKEDVPMKAEKAVVEYHTEEPLPPIHGFVGVLKALVSSLIMATRDPFQNYHEGVIAMGQKKLLPVVADTAGADPKPTPEAAAWMAKRQAAQTAKEPSTVVVDSKIVAMTKTRLEAVKVAADKGDAEAKKKWNLVNTNYKNKKVLAAKGDEKAQTLIGVLEATGLFKS